MRVALNTICDIMWTSNEASFLCKPVQHNNDYFKSQDTDTNIDSIELLDNTLWGRNGPNITMAHLQYVVVMK